MGISGAAPGMRSWLSRASGLALVASFVVSANANDYAVRPIQFVNDPGFRITAAGTVSTLAGTGLIQDWNLTVSTVEQIAHYTNRNTARFLTGVSVSGDGRALQVATSPDPATQDGGMLAFRAANPLADFGTTLADFTGANASSGQAMYMAGGAFDFLDLGQAAASLYVAATTGAPELGLFTLSSLAFANGVTLSGTILTDGTRGDLTASNVLAWDIYVNQITQDVFTPTNSALFSQGVSLSVDGQNLLVDHPGGNLTVSKGRAGGRPYALQIADFTDPGLPGGQAGYFQGRLATYTVDLHAPAGPWAVTGAALISQNAPEPGALSLTVLGLAAMGGAAISRTRSGRCSVRRRGRFRRSPRGAARPATRDCPCRCAR